MPNELLNWWMEVVKRFRENLLRINWNSGLYSYSSKPDEGIARKIALPSYQGIKIEGIIHNETGYLFGFCIGKSKYFVCCGGTNSDQENGKAIAKLYEAKKENEVIKWCSIGVEYPANFVQKDATAANLFLQNVLNQIIHTNTMREGDLHIFALLIYECARNPLLYKIIKDNFNIKREIRHFVTIAKEWNKGNPLSESKVDSSPTQNATVLLRAVKNIGYNDKFVENIDEHSEEKCRYHYIALCKSLALEIEMPLIKGWHKIVSKFV